MAATSPSSSAAGDRRLFKRTRAVMQYRQPRYSTNACLLFHAIARSWPRTKPHAAFLSGSTPAHRPSHCPTKAQHALLRPRGLGCSAAARVRPFVSSSSSSSPVVWPVPVPVFKRPTRPRSIVTVQLVQLHAGCFSACRPTTASTCDAVLLPLAAFFTSVAFKPSSRPGAELHISAARCAPQRRRSPCAPPRSHVRQAGSCPVACSVAQLQAGARPGLHLGQACPLR